MLALCVLHALSACILASEQQSVVTLMQGWAFPGSAVLQQQQQQQQQRQLQQPHAQQIVRKPSSGDQLVQVSVTIMQALLLDCMQWSTRSACLPYSGSFDVSLGVFLFSYLLHLWITQDRRRATVWLPK